MTKGKLRTTAAVVVLVMAWMVVHPCVALAQGGDYQQGYEDGRKAGETHLNTSKKIGWGAAGFLTGIIGTLIAYLHKPRSTAEGYVDDQVSAEYRDGFVKGFCEVVTKKRGKYALIGWGAWVGFYLATGSQD